MYYLKLCSIIMMNIVLLGCSLTPGSHVDGKVYYPHSKPYELAQKQLKKDLSKVNIQVINSRLLAQQSLAKQKAFEHFPPKKVYVSLEKNYQYKVGIADILAVNVWDHPELTISAGLQRTAAFDGFRVQPDGTFNFAYASKQKAEGKTISQIQNNLTNKLSKVIENPQVDVKVISFNSQKVYVTGEVNQPGIFPITDVPLTLIDVMSLAGGLTDQANWRSVSFSRDQTTENIALDSFYRNGDITQNKLLKHGDIIHVGRNDSEKVFVLGDIETKGKVAIDRYGLTLAQALAESGGINEATANANGIFVLRKTYNNTNVLADVYQLHAKNITAYVLADQFELQPRDIIYVTTAPVARWNRLINQLIPTVENLNTVYDLRNKSSLFRP